MSRGKRTLSEEEKILWHRVARTVKPLSGVKVPVETLPPVARATSAKAISAANGVPAPAEKPFKPFLPPYIPPVSKPASGSHFDRPTHAKIAGGRLSVDARIDLHGMTQADAHGTLIAFLHRAHAVGHRHVLVITGKGRMKGGEGVLRRAVPGWFVTPAFRGLVSAWATAARHHGGEGALYVRLRRADP